MGKPVIIYGKSGSGKTRSLKFFKKDEIAFINCESKDLSFDDVEFDMTMNLNRYGYTPLVINALNKIPENVKIIVIDDAGYLMTHYFMANHRKMKGNAQFEMYNQIADETYELINTIKALPKDKIVYLMYQIEESDATGDIRPLTIGKLLDQKCNLVGMVTVCLLCMSADGKHFFRTVTDGNDVTKAPEKMFEADEIPNDLKAVDTAIRKYYKMDPLDGGDADAKA